MKNFLKYPSSLFLIIILILVFCFYFFLFKDRVWFFHDDFDILIGDLNFSPSYLLSPHGDHLLPMTKAFHYLIFSIFGLNFTPYFISAILLHLLNLGLLWLIVKRLTNKNFFAYMAVLLFAVNVTFFEVILWPNYPTFSCSLFAGLAFLFWLKSREDKKLSNLLLSGFFSLLSAFSLGVGLGYPLVLAVLSFLDKKSEKRAGVFFTFLGLTVLLIFFYLTRENFQTGNLSLSLSTLIQIPLFLYTGLVEAILLRFFYPLFPTRFLEFNRLIMPFLVMTVFAFLAWVSFFSGRTKERLFLKIALIINILYPYAIIALKRAQLSPKQALAERYAYIPLFFFIIFLLYQLSFLKVKKWFKTVCLLFIFYTLITQSVVFYKRSVIFTRQMIINKQFFSQLKEKVRNNEVKKDCKIPEFPTGRQDPCSRYIKLLNRY